MRARWIAAVGLALVGLVWIVQGLGLVGGSGYMIGSTFWAIAGLVLVVVAAAIAWTAIRARPKA